jgi:ABC-type oligopeptide transport system substrate-binding subunit
MHRIATIALIALATSFGLAACGGSDDKSSDDGTLSRGELASKADAICKTGANDVDTVDAPSSLEDANVAAEYFGKLVPLHQKQTDALAALKPDAEAKVDWDAFMATQNDNQALLDTILAKAKAKDATGQQDVAQIPAKTQAFAAAAKKIGSEECAGTA